MTFKNNVIEEQEVITDKLALSGYESDDVHELKHITAVDAEEEPTKFSFSVIRLLGWEGILVTIGLLAAALAGSIVCFEVLYFGTVIDSLAPPTISLNPFQQVTRMNDAYRGTIFMIIMVLVGAFCGYVEDLCINLAGAKLDRRLKQQVLASIMKQDISYFDKNSTSK
jgi:ABC-type multidrug transport system fused ATPase/permease subunit